MYDFYTFIKHQNFGAGISPNVPAVWMPLSRQYQRFGGPALEMRGISRAGKLCRSKEAAYG
jgi:hypothetical protein